MNPIIAQQAHEHIHLMIILHIFKYTNIQVAVIKILEHKMLFNKCKSWMCENDYRRSMEGSVRKWMALY